MYNIRLLVRGWLISIHHYFIVAIPFLFLRYSLFIPVKPSNSRSLPVKISSSQNSLFKRQSCKNFILHNASLKTSIMNIRITVCCTVWRLSSWHNVLGLHKWVFKFPFYPILVYQFLFGPVPIGLPWEMGKPASPFQLQMSIIYAK